MLRIGSALDRALEVRGAVTGAPSLNLSPLRTVIVYVLPSRDTRGNPAAASGTSREPSGAGLSG